MVSDAPCFIDERRQLVVGSLGVEVGLQLCANNKKKT